MKNKFISLNLNEDLYKKIKTVADKKQLSVSAMIRLLILENLDK